MRTMIRSYTDREASAMQALSNDKALAAACAPFYGATRDSDEAMHALRAVHQQRYDELVAVGRMEAGFAVVIEHAGYGDYGAIYYLTLREQPRMPLVWEGDQA